MLARIYGPKYNKFSCYVQPKLNGVRALAQIVGGVTVLQSRDEKLWNYTVIQQIADEIAYAHQIVGDTILDGELYKHGWKLQKINGAIAVNRNGPSKDSKEIEFHVFDTINPARPFSDRWIDISNALRTADLPHIRVVDTSLVHDRDQLDRYFHMSTALGYEGVMLRPDGPYEFGVTGHGTQKRSEYLWKYKSWLDDEFLCIGVSQGEGKADIGIGALILITIDGGHFKVGTGFDDAERVEFMKNPPIGKLVRVRYLCLTEDGIPFNPSFICVMQ